MVRKPCHLTPLSTRLLRLGFMQTTTSQRAPDASQNEFLLTRLPHYCLNIFFIIIVFSLTSRGIENWLEKSRVRAIGGNIIVKQI